jgi:hypothetical protein
MSLHLHHVPQADMLECRLEILLNVPHPKNLHVWICSPRGVSTTTYWQMTHIWWHLWKYYTTWHMAGGSHRLICIKPILFIKVFVKLSFKILVYKGQDNRHTLHTGQNVVLGATQQSWNFRNHHPSGCMALRSYLWVSSQVLKHSEMVMRFVRIFHDLETQLSITEDTAKRLDLTPCRSCALSP